MNTRLPAPYPRRRLLTILMCLTASGAVPAGEGAGLPDPADAGAPAPAISADPALPQGAGGYLGSVDAPRLPWTRLFRPDGEFVPESELRPDGAPGAASRGGDPAGHAHGAAPMHAAGAPPVQASARAAPAGSDAHGVVRAVDLAQGKVTLRHGPIERLEMPGMTMIFRVRDKAVLEGIDKGDEVDFDVEIDGTTFYVTSLRRQGAAK